MGWDEHSLKVYIYIYIIPDFAWDTMICPQEMCDIVLPNQFPYQIQIVFVLQEGWWFSLSIGWVIFVVILKPFPHPSLDVPLSNFIPMLLAVENRNKSSPVIRAVANNYYNIN